MGEAVIVVFVPMIGSHDITERCPPFAEEMDYVPRKGDRVMFYKAENRHPVANAWSGRSARVGWTVKNDPLIVPDLGAVVVDVQLEDYNSSQDFMTKLCHAAVALDIPEPSFDLETSEEKP